MSAWRSMHSVSRPEAGSDPVPVRPPVSGEDSDSKIDVRDYRGVGVGGGRGPVSAVCSVLVPEACDDDDKTPPVAAAARDTLPLRAPPPPTPGESSAAARLSPPPLPLTAVILDMLPLPGADADRVSTPITGGTKA